MSNDIIKRVCYHEVHQYYIIKIWSFKFMRFVEIVNPSTCMYSLHFPFLKKSNAYTTFDL